MHTCRSKVDSSGMPIGLCRPRPASINWSAMPYSSSRGVHPRPTTKHQKIAASLWCHKNPFTPKNEMNSLQELQRIWISQSKEKQSVLYTMGIMHTSASKVDNSGMPIGSCRPRLGSIDWSAMPYNLSRGVHPRPPIKQ